MDCSTAQLSDLFFQTDHDLLADQFRLCSIRRERISWQIVVIGALHHARVLLLFHNESSSGSTGRFVSRADSCIVTTYGGDLQTFID